MKRNAAEAAGLAYRMSAVASEEFTRMLNRLDRLSGPQSGWDPYEVWRTRVKGSAGVMWERDRGPSRWQVTAGAAGRRLRTALQSVTSFATLAADIERNVRKP